MVEDYANIKILRFNPENDIEPYFQSFKVPLEEGMTVLKALQYIYEELDSSLAYRDFCCNKGICLSCTLIINGKKRKSCNTLLSSLLPSVVIEPLLQKDLVKDLVVVLP